MRIVSLTIKKIFRSGIYNGIIIIFVICSVFLMNDSLSEFNHMNYIDSLVEKAGLNGRYVYVARSSKPGNYEDGMYEKMTDYINTQMAALEENKEIDSCYSTSENMGMDEMTGKEVSYFYSDINFLKDVVFDVYKGCWFDEYERTDDAVPVVIGYDFRKDYKVGDRISLDSMDEEGVVVGILGNKKLFLKATMGGTSLDINSCTQISNDMMIVGCDEKQSEGFDSGAYFIKISDENGEKEVMDSLADVADCFSFTKLYDSGKEGNERMLEMKFILAFMAFLICFVGVGASNILEVERNRKETAIYFICGMSEKEQMLMQFIESCIKLYIPTIIGLVIYRNYSNNNTLEDGVYLSLANIVVSFVIISVIALDSFIRVGKINRKFKLLNMLGE